VPSFSDDILKASQERISSSIDSKIREEALLVRAALDHKYMIMKRLEAKHGVKKTAKEASNKIMEQAVNNGLSIMEAEAIGRHFAAQALSTGEILADIVVPANVSKVAWAAQTGYQTPVTPDRPTVEAAPKRRAAPRRKKHKKKSSKKHKKK
jgi:hypothetical protein